MLGDASIVIAGLDQTIHGFFLRPQDVDAGTRPGMTRKANCAILYL